MFLILNTFAYELRFDIKQLSAFNMSPTSSLAIYFEDINLHYRYFTLNIQLI